MGTLLFYGVVTVVVGVVAVGLLIVFLPPGRIVAPVVAADVIPDGLPASGELVADDVARIRLPVAVRGYRMTEVDAILDRLAAELELRDRRLAELARRSAPSAPVSEPDADGPGPRSE